MRWVRCRTQRVKAIRAARAAHIPVSATIGDPTDDAEATARAVVAMAATGVDIVKVGLSARRGRGATTLSALAASTSPTSCSSACCWPIAASISTSSSQLRAAGFAGLMLDTADKRRGALPDIVPAAALQRFVAATHAAGMFAGLAGSLRAEHVADLLEFAPDVLGFRGGLCRRGDRTATLDPDAVRAVRRAVPFCDSRVPLGGGMARHQAEDVA